jgi:hypothetical protein
MEDCARLANLRESIAPVGKTRLAHCAIVGRHEPPIRIGPLLLTMGLAVMVDCRPKSDFRNAAGKNKFS